MLAGNRVTGLVMRWTAGRRDGPGQLRTDRVVAGVRLAAQSFIAVLAAVHPFTCLRTSQTQSQVRAVQSKMPPCGHPLTTEHGRTPWIAPITLSVGKGHNLE